MMDQEAKRIAIAEACGWTQNKHNSRYWTSPLGESTMVTPFPDYLNDLNAMHAAIMAQSDDSRVSINHTLMEMLRPDEKLILDRTINATAAQRAEAFGRTLGLWT
jgi:hypothetical protein